MHKTIEFRSQIWSFIRLTRVVFLLGGILLFSLGAVTAYLQGFQFNWVAFIIGQIAVTTTQLTAHYSNEYYDIECDRLVAGNRTWFSGGSGILSDGGLKPQAVLSAARTSALVAIVFGILSIAYTPWMLPIILLSLAGSWFYSAPPLALMSSGWGEFTTSVIVAVLVPFAGYTMQAGTPPWGLLPLLIPLAAIHMAMLISFEFPDRFADIQVGKRTITVRLGFAGAAVLHSFLLLLGYLIFGGLAVLDAAPVRWVWLSAPLALWQIIQISRFVRSTDPRRYRILTTGGVGLFALASLLVLIDVLTAFW